MMWLCNNPEYWMGEMWGNLMETPPDLEWAQRVEYNYKAITRYDNLKHLIDAAVVH